MVNNSTSKGFVEKRSGLLAVLESMLGGQSQVMASSAGSEKLDGWTLFVTFVGTALILAGVAMSLFSWV